MIFLHVSQTKPQMLLRLKSMLKKLLPIVLIVCVVSNAVGVFFKLGHYPGGDYLLLLSLYLFFIAMILLIVRVFKII